MTSIMFGTFMVLAYVLGALGVLLAYRFQRPVWYWLTVVGHFALLGWGMGVIGA